MTDVVPSGVSRIGIDERFGAASATTAFPLVPSVPAVSYFFLGLEFSPLIRISMQFEAVVTSMSLVATMRAFICMRGACLSCHTRFFHCLVRVS